ncbi:hypothetical protein COY28_02090 [Candidatus Woesearchaeota archaeon CG_4_10_14_0_2_um_filter_57_5]|nr:MAG: hypothetical protein COY28_02090 [Candidatus Woesearchaeota archaeon CG_4_10_14_0_2_um_filter_57_5]
MPQARGFLSMAHISLDDLTCVRSPLWQATITYYCCYYSLTAVLVAADIKSEIHQCTLAAMDHAVPYPARTKRSIHSAFRSRINAQYHTRDIGSQSTGPRLALCREVLLESQAILADKHIIAEIRSAIAYM